MAFRVHIDPAARRGTVVAYDAASGEEAVAAMEALFLDPAWESGFDALWDLTGVRTIDMDREGAAALALRVRVLEPLMGPGRGAFAVAEGDQRRLTEAILHLTRVPGRERRVFPTLDEARAWLDEARAPTP